MKLAKLFESAPNIEVKNISIDSRTKMDRVMYFCMGGFTFDGHDFVEQAISNGAVAIVHSKELKKYHHNVAYIKVSDVGATLNLIASRFYDYPSKELFMYGITGTNGKTTIASIIQDFYSRKSKAGYIGTLGVHYEGFEGEPTLTTPDTISIHSTLAGMVSAGCKACAMEVSSHGLELGRVDSVDFDIAIFTNLTHDHLDFHGTFENYKQAKQKLFKNLKESGTAIFNIDDDCGKDMMKGVRAKRISYGEDTQAMYRIMNAEMGPRGSKFTLMVQGEEYAFETNLIAKYNIYNLTAAIAALHLSGFTMSELQEYSKSVKQVEGRMEIIDEGQSFNVIVDFAHTPDGIEKVLSYAKSITPEKGRLVAVFGSAGKRDVKKRKIFGEIADKYCDTIILTEDDPRDESPKEIAEQIKEGVKDTSVIYLESRYDAIRQAIESANANDTIAILGKGDEVFMYAAEGKVPWDGDHIVARKCIHKYILNEPKN